MRYGVLGTGVVGRTLGTRLVELGNEVCMGARAAGSPAAREWVASAAGGAREGSFADAASFGGDPVAQCVRARRGPMTPGVALRRYVCRVR